MPGGPIAIDLLNTTWNNDGQMVDWLDADSAVRDFAKTYGMNCTTADLSAVRQSLVRARGMIRDVLSTPVASEQWSALQTRINDELAQASLVLTVSSDLAHVEPTHCEPTRQLAIRALVNAIDVKRDRGGRTRCCAHPDCMRWFVDTSKSGRRRWCSMERCGNRAKAQRHYERTRPTKRAG